jgi:hypothetical protein
MLYTTPIPTINNSRNHNMSHKIFKLGLLHAYIIIKLLLDQIDQIDQR